MANSASELQSKPETPANRSAARTRQIRMRLLAWYSRAARDLPWRRTNDAYQIWLSEVMLQQTRVETVIPYYERFLAAFPDVAKLAAAPLERVLRLWAGLGYYSRARNLHAAAKAVAGEFNREFPRTAATLEALPGVGRYTAAAIASIAFGEAVAVLDGNVKRVLARLDASHAPVNTPRAAAALWKRADELLDCKSPGDFNQAMMELGATICTPRGPRCGECPLHSACKAARAGIQASLPIMAKKKASPVVYAAAAAIVRDGAILLVRRPASGLLGGMWELPGCVLETPADAATQLANALNEDFGLKAEIGASLGEIRHIFTHRDWRVTVCAARCRGRRVRLQRHDSAAWVHAKEIDALPLSALDRKVLAIVR